MHISTKPEIINVVSCIKKFNNFKKQKIYEALIILKEKRIINKPNKEVSIKENLLLFFFQCFKDIPQLYLIIRIIKQLLKVYEYMTCKNLNYPDDVSRTKEYMMRNVNQP